MEIRENITYGLQKDILENDIIEAAKDASIYEEILHSLGGLDGVVAEGGNNISGGRIAIARVLLKNPDIIIFDEATSALDNTNEAIVQKNIELKFKGKTTITIAHRLSTLINSDAIFVFKDGKITQQGDFINLSNQEGLFKDFLNQKSD